MPQSVNARIEERRPHQLTRIDSDLTATTDHDDTAIIGQKFRVVGEVHVREHFEDEVDTGPAGRLHDLLEVA